MTLTELIATLGPVGGVALFMWLNRSPQKADRADPIAQKLDALIEEVRGHRSDTKAQNATFSEFAKGLAILLDRSER